MTQLSLSLRPIARVAAALTIIAAGAVGDLLAGPAGSATPVQAADCLKPELTRFAGPTEIMPNPGNFYSFTLQVDNPNPAGTCNDGIQIEIAFTKTTNPVDRMFGDFGVACTSVKQAGAAYVEHCVRATFAGGEHGELLFNMKDLAVGEDITATIKPMRGNYGSAVYRPGKTGTGTVTITGVMAPTMTPPPPPGAGAAPAPGGGAAPAPKPQGFAAAPVTAPTVQDGASVDTVTALQYLLRQSGQDVVVDGDFGDQTTGAVRSFQEAKGLTVTGAVDTQTWAALWVTLKQGDERTDAVLALQTLLNTRGFDVAVDGDFGPQTDAAVRAFQGQKPGLTANGVVNAATWAALLAVN
jgi:peptidoglycan hydrolase-like protein with peptidoglycan-binding domain